MRPVEGGQGRGVSEAPEGVPVPAVPLLLEKEDSGPRLREPPLHEHPTLAPAIKGEEPKPAWARASPTDRLMTAAVVGEDRESRQLPPPPGVCFVSVLLCRPETRALARATNCSGQRCGFGRVTVQPEGPFQA